MDDLEREQTTMLAKVENFGTENDPVIKDHAKVKAAFTLVKTANAALAAKGITRTSAGETKFSLSARRKMLRHAYIGTLSLIAKAARDIERNDEDFVNKFRLPQANRSDLVWIETGRSFAADIVPVKELFEDYAIDDAYLIKLDADTVQFEQTISGQDTSNRSRIAADADIDDIIGDALKAVRTLKISVPIIFKDNPGKLADWETASHVEKPPAVKKDEEEKPK